MDTRHAYLWATRFVINGLFSRAKMVVQWKHHPRMGLNRHIGRVGAGVSAHQNGKSNCLTLRNMELRSDQ